MPIMDGLKMIEKIKKINSSIVAVVVSAFSEVEYFQKAIKIGVDRYLLKPIDIEKLLFLFNKISVDMLQQKQLREYAVFSKIVMDTTQNLIFLVSNGKMEFKNRSLLNKLNMDDIDYENITIYKYILDKNGNKKFKNMKNMLNFFKKNYDKQIIIYMHEELNNPKSSLNAYIVTNSYFENSDKYLIIFTDITKINKEKEEFRTKALTDSLTNIGNKLYFNNLLSIMIHKALKDYRYKLSIIIFDIDFFKDVNDTYGHQIGDEVLKELAFLVKKTVRKDDILARWGGEEFVIIGNFDMQGAVMLAHKLRKQIESFQFEKVKRITCSFGVSQFLNKNDDEDKLLSRADEALYFAKKSGRNRVEFKGCGN